MARSSLRLLSKSSLLKYSVPLADWLEHGQPLGCSCNYYHAVGRRLRSLSGGSLRLVIEVNDENGCGSIGCR